ncbi:MAG: hypothetical protein AB8G99_13970 [Planctomycetaceae bacterium]
MAGLLVSGSIRACLLPDGGGSVNDGLVLLACIGMLAIGTVYGIWSGRDAAIQRARMKSGARAQNPVVTGIGLFGVAGFAGSSLVREYRGKPLHLFAVGFGLLALHSFIWFYAVQQPHTKPTDQPLNPPPDRYYG